MFCLILVSYIFIFGIDVKDCQANAKSDELRFHDLEEGVVRIRVLPDTLRPPLPPLTLPEAMPSAVEVDEGRPVTARARVRPKVSSYQGAHPQLPGIVIEGGKVDLETIQAEIKRKAMARNESTVKIAESACAGIPVSDPKEAAKANVLKRGKSKLSRVLSATTLKKIEDGYSREDEIPSLEAVAKTQAHQGATASVREHTPPSVRGGLAGSTSVSPQNKPTSCSCAIL